MPHVQTVLGPVDPAVLAGVLSHEHLLSLSPGPWLADPVDAAGSALAGLAERGINTIVDLSPYGDAGRDATGANVVLLKDIARRTGLHIIAGTATYRAEFSPAWVRQATLAELAERFVADATTGISDTGVRAGILGEQPTGLGEMTAHERTGLLAAARAHHATGLAVNTHTTHGTMALAQVDLLTGAGVAADRIVIGHLDNHAELDPVRRVLDRGVHIAFDSIGKQFWDTRMPATSRPDGEYEKAAVSRSDQTRADRLARLVAEGYAERILLSQDLTGGQVWQNPTTHGRLGYHYLPEVFTALLTERGVTPAQLNLLLHTNPVRVLTIS